MTLPPVPYPVMANTGETQEDAFVFSSPLELLSYLRSHDIRLWLDEDRLRYSAPDGAMTPALRAKIAQHKVEIIDFFRQAKTAVQVAPPPIAPLPRDAALPLSFAQQRLWLLDQLMPGSSLNNIFQAVRLQGLLSVAALRQTLNEIARRHEVLRTTFPARIDGRPIQSIAPPSGLALPLIDLSGLPQAEQEAEVRRLAMAEANRAFDLAHGPLWRVSLLRLGQMEHVVLFSMHHIVGDGWSIGVLVQEVAALYEAFSNGRPSPLPDLPLQYADFAHWQWQWLQGEVLDTHLSYWKQQLDGAPDGLQLPTDHPRPAVQTFQGEHYVFTLPETLSESLQALSRQEGVTLFMTLLAAFKTLLYRCTGQEDILVGTPIANRNRAEIERLIGFFVNILILRTDLSGNPSFKELLERVREITLGAYAHQDLPFEKLVDELRPEHDLSRAPFAQVAFALQNAPVSTLELSNLTLSPLRLENRTAKTDLVLFMSEGPTGLKGVFEYNTNLFDGATIARMAEFFQALLEGIVANPEECIWPLSP